MLPEQTPAFQPRVQACGRWAAVPTSGVRLRRPCSTHLIPGPRVSPAGSQEADPGGAGVQGVHCDLGVRKREGQAGRRGQAAPQTAPRVAEVAAFTHRLATGVGARGWSWRGHWGPDTWQIHCLGDEGGVCVQLGEGDRAWAPPVGLVLFQGCFQPNSPRLQSIWGEKTVQGL